LARANKDLAAKVRALGIEVKNHMSNLDAEDVARVKRALDKERQANLVEERLSSTVIRRRSKDGAVVARAAPPGPSAPVAERPSRLEPPLPAAPPAEERSVVARAKEVVREVVQKVEEVAHDVVEKIVPQEKPVEPTVVEPRREEAPRRVVVETRAEPRVER